MKKFLNKIALFFIVFIAINIVINYVYELPAKKAIENKIHKNFLKWTDIHNNKNTYDLVTIGASRAYTAFNPKILDSALNLESYNMGTSAQDIAESYYTLREVLDYQKPKYVVLDLFFPSSDNVHDYYQIYSNASFFTSNNYKYDLVTEGYGGTGIANYFIPIIKFKNYIKQDLNGLFSKGNSPKQEVNWIKGFLYDTVTVTKPQIEKFTPISDFKNTAFDEERFKTYFNKIKSLTQKHNIKLICVRTPYPPSRLALNEIDDEGNFFKEFMATTEIPFYDLNFYKSETYKYTDFDFSDYHHPNYRGAEKASMQLVKAIKKDIINN